jgi:hypothetical protein
VGIVLDLLSGELGLMVGLYSIENNPDHLRSIMLLGAIGMLDNSEDVLEAVMDDLRAVRGRDGLDKSSKQKVDRLLSRIAQLQVSPPSSLSSIQLNDISFREMRTPQQSPPQPYSSSRHSRAHGATYLS